MSDNIVKPQQDPNMAFEKYKYKIELFKWLIVSVGIVIATMIIDWGFKDRASGLQEVQQYDKYATELIILNDNPKSKRMLAQYFSKVIPSDKLRTGWKDYYSDVDREYTEFLIADSLAKLKIAQLKKDTTKLSEQQKEEITQLENKVKNNQRVINEPLVLPAVSSLSTPTVYVQIAREDQRKMANQLTDKIIELGFKAPGVELVENSIQISVNEIRYFRDNDLEFAKTLQATLKNQNIDAALKPIPSMSSRTKQGTLELWLK